MTLPAHKQAYTISTHVSDAVLREMLGYHIKRASNVIQADLAQTLQAFDLRMITYTALVLIAENPGLSQAKLADAMAVERPNLVVIVDELEKRGLIMRNRVPEDRRAYALTTTLAGRQLFEKATKSVRQHEERLLTPLTAELRAAVVEAMSLIRQQSAET